MRDFGMIILLALTFWTFYGFTFWCDRVVNGDEEQ